MRLYDVAYIEAAPRYYQREPLTLVVKLTDFSVYYSQGIVQSITAELKAGKSEVVCDGRKMTKVSKNEDGVVTWELLTKAWTDNDKQ